MQYFDKLGDPLRLGFVSTFQKNEKPKKFDTFLYRHFKSNGHSPSKIVIQPVEKLYMIQIHQLDKKI